MTIGEKVKSWLSDVDEDKEVVEIDTSAEVSKGNEDLRYVIFRKEDKKAYLGIVTGGYVFDDDHIDINVLPSEDPEKKYSRFIEVTLIAEEFPKEYGVIENCLRCDKTRTYRLKLPFAVKCENAVDRGATFDKTRLMLVVELKEYNERKSIKLPTL
ncbi:hypothetical protein IKF04_00690 [Candidatus Saccharibacteria bacterium]|nr:hypothetical protein [Candidatus Saccharibacteria bacterium]